MASVSWSSPPLAGLDATQRVKNSAVQNVAARSYEIRRCVPHGRLFHHAYDLLHTLLVCVLDIDHAEIRHVRRDHLHRKQHGTDVLLAHANQIARDGGGLNGITGKHNRRSQCDTAQPNSLVEIRSGNERSCG